MDQVSKVYLENRKVLLYALAVGIALLGVKLFAAWLSNSTSILSDALESVVNVVSGVFGLYALHFANLPKDKNHPYGHGKIEFIAAAFEGGLLFIAGLGVMGKAAYHIVFPQTIRDLQDGLILVAIAGVINYFLGFLLEKKGSENRSLVLISGGKHLKSDAYSSLVLIGGAFLVFLTGKVWLDNLLAFCFGAFLIYTGYQLLKASFSGILDEADYDLIEDLVHHLDQFREPDWIDVHNLRVIKYGSKIHLDCHMTVPWYYTVEEAHVILDKMENALKSFNKDSVELFIHTDPCQPFSCGICSMPDCQQRKYPQIVSYNWTLELALQNSKHRVIDSSDR